jgi:hypothetical protein
MSTQTVPMIGHQEEKAEQAVAPGHLALYGWIYLVFAVLTALALYVMFTFPQGEI